MDADKPPRDIDERSIDEGSVDPDPLEQFANWFAQVGEAVNAPEAMALATADGQGRPSARMVLLKSWGPDGFVFYTNYDGRKSCDLETNPEAALLFYWEAFGWQVRIEGSATRTTGAESDAYYATRDIASRIGTYASHQSRPIGSRAELDAKVADWSATFADGDVPRPEWWGGWRVTPRAYEFWQQGRNRLHDRVRYEAVDGGWTVQRLQP